MSGSSAPVSAPRVVDHQAPPIGPPSTAGAHDQVSLVDVTLVAASLLLAVSGWASLTLAQASMRHTVLVVFATVLAAAGLAALVVRWRPRWSFDPRDALLAGGLLVVSGLMFLPGFPYAVADKDPGVYVNIAALISERGATNVVDEAAAAGLETHQYNATWTSPRSEEMIQPQFYHLWPALQANVHDVTGQRGVFHLTPALAALSVALMGLTARRVFGFGVGALAGTFLALNMMQVWAAKTPGSEILAQLLFVAALWGVVVAFRSRWPIAAAAAGFATGLTFLVRPDGLLLIMFAAAVAAALLVVARADRLLGWFAMGAGVILPFAAYQAWWQNRSYSAANGVPSLTTAGVVVAGPLLVAAVIRIAGSGWRPRVVAFVLRTTGRRDVQAWCGAALAVAFGAFLIVNFARPELFGEDWAVSLRSGEIRTFKEDTLIRLSWFFTPVGIALLWLGTAAVACSRWRFDRWLLILPGLSLVPIYIIDPSIASRMMWWTRRFIPIVIVVMVMLMAVGVMWLWKQQSWRRWVGRALAAGLVIYLVIALAGQSFPLREHREFAHSPDIVADLASLAGGDAAVFLWENPNSADVFHPAKLYGLPLWFVHDHISRVLPAEADDADLRRWQAAFPDLPLFIVTTRGEPPEDLSVDETPVHLIDTWTPVWDERNLGRPREPIEDDVTVRIQVWSPAP